MVRRDRTARCHAGRRPRSSRAACRRCNRGPRPRTRAATGRRRAGPCGSAASAAARRRTRRPGRRSPSRTSWRRWPGRAYCPAARSPCRSRPSLPSGNAPRTCRTCCRPCVGPERPHRSRSVPSWNSLQAPSLSEWSRHAARRCDGHVSKSSAGVSRLTSKRVRIVIFRDIVGQRPVLGLRKIKRTTLGCLGTGEAKAQARRNHGAHGYHRLALLAFATGALLAVVFLPTTCSISGVANTCMSLAMTPVQPVWWLAPRPAPLSPWKYSWNDR